MSHGLAVIHPPPPYRTTSSVTRLRTMPCPGQISSAGSAGVCTKHTPWLPSMSAGELAPTELRGDSCQQGARASRATGRLVSAGELALTERREDSCQQGSVLGQPRFCRAWIRVTENPDNATMRRVCSASMEPYMIMIK